MSAEQPPLRLGLLQYAVKRIESLAHFAQRFDALVAEGAAGAELLLMPEYACMEIASALTREPDPMAELNAVCTHSDQIPRHFPRHGNAPWRLAAAWHAAVPQRRWRGA